MAVDIERATTRITVHEAIASHLPQKQQQQQQQQQHHQLQVTENDNNNNTSCSKNTFQTAVAEAATIIDIPTTTTSETTTETTTRTTTYTPASTAASTPATTPPSTPAKYSAALHTFAASPSTCYDTDCSSSSSIASSVASSMRCHRHGEHIYMQRVAAAVAASAQHHHLHQARALEEAAAAASAAAQATAAGGAATSSLAATAVIPGVTRKASLAAAAATTTAAATPAIALKTFHKRSWPVFIVLISLIEIVIFVYDFLTVQTWQSQDPIASLAVPIPTDSVFIYRPDRRLEVWRFVSYMFLHANWFHLGFNVVVQLFYGIPLEVMHGSARVAVIYFAGVFAGSLGTSVVDSEVYLVGASGGVYALLAAHLANITLNYGHMKYAVAQLFSVVIFVSCDLGYAFYTQYLAVIDPTSLAASAPPVSYIAHLTGALAGLTIGLLVLKNFEHRAYENLIWWLALGVYSAFTVFAIVFNLINTMTAQLIEEQGEVITQHLLHDLGVS